MKVLDHGIEYAEMCRQTKQTVLIKASLNLRIIVHGFSHLDPAFLSHFESGVCVFREAAWFPFFPRTLPENSWRCMYFRGSRPEHSWVFEERHFKKRENGIPMSNLEPASSNKKKTSVGCPPRVSVATPPRQASRGDELKVTQYLAWKPPLGESLVCVSGRSCHQGGVFSSHGF